MHPIPHSALQWLRSAAGLATVAATAVLAAPAHAVQGADAQEKLALFEVSFYGNGANSLEPLDMEVATLADTIMRSALAQSGRFRLIDRSEISAELARAEGNGVSCVTLACRRDVAQRLGARWMVTSKFSKTSNLIWYLSGQLTEVPTNRRHLDDEFELKGNRDEIARGGSRSLARRIVTAADRPKVYGTVVPGSETVDTPPAKRLDAAQVKALIERSSEGSPPDFSGMDLSGIDLAGVDFKRALLLRARLSGANLTKANLFTCDLTDAVVTGANLTGANLDGTILRRADFSRSILKQASLFSTIVEETNLTGADLSGTRIIGYWKKAKLPGANLRGTSAGVDMGNQSMGIMRANFSSADLSRADLTDANLFKADLTRADLREAKLVRANLTSAELYGADLTGADVTGAIVEKADLSGAIFKQARGVKEMKGLDNTRNRDKAIFDE